MSGEIRLTGKVVIAIILGVFIVSVSGVLLGSWFVGWKASAGQDEIYKAHFNRLGILRPGMPPPRVAVLDTAGNEHSLPDLISGRRTILLFLSLGCDPCTDVVERWRQFADALPADVQIIGINNGQCDGVPEYIAETKMPYPVYCDTAHSLPLEYDIVQFPSIMGISRKGTIAFLGAGVFSGFTLRDALNLIPER